MHNVIAKSLGSFLKIKYGGPLMNLIKKILILIIGVQSAWAGPHHEGLVSTVNLGARYSSVYVRRGVIVYRDYQIDPVISLFFLDDRLEFVGDSLGFRDFIYQDKIRLRTRMVSISDNAFFPDHASVSEGMPDRPTTYEWSNSIEAFFPGYNDDYQAELGLSHNLDVTRHYGNYFELIAKVKFLNNFSLPVIGKLAEPNLVATIGWGDARHNQYFYGPSDDKDGFNNVSYGVWLAFPNDADRFYPIVQLMRFQTLGSHGSAEYSRGRNKGVLFSAIWAAPIFSGAKIK